MIETGYAALKPVLMESGVYSELCEPGIKYCSASDTRMNFMFTVATVITNVSASSQNCFQNIWIFTDGLAGVQFLGLRFASGLALGQVWPQEHDHRGSHRLSSRQPVVWSSARQQR